MDRRKRGRQTELSGDVEGRPRTAGRAGRRSPAQAHGLASERSAHRAAGTCSTTIEGGVAMSSAAQASPAAQPQPVTGARLVVEALEREGVRHVFGYPGGAIMPVYDALPGSSLQHILVRHEQAAALAADAYGRVTGRPGVCIATSGPGATNLVTGIANAFLDSVPVVAITGQVATPLMGTDAFQEVDIFGITLPIVKHSFIVRRTADIPRIFAEAFHLARSGRPGPVLIDLPKDMGVMSAAPEPFTAPADQPRPLDELAIARADRL